MNLVATERFGRLLSKILANATEWNIYVSVKSDVFICFDPRAGCITRRRNADKVHADIFPTGCALNFIRRQNICEYFYTVEFWRKINLMLKAPVVDFVYLEGGCNSARPGFDQDGHRRNRKESQKESGSL
jgi:hypothetical protein